MRNRSRDIADILLSNPRHSKYLYRPNKRGETPYKIDASLQKSILTTIFGQRMYLRPLEIGKSDDLLSLSRMNRSVEFKR